MAPFRTSRLRTPLKQTGRLMLLGGLTLGLTGTTAEAPAPAPEPTSPVPDDGQRWFYRAAPWAEEAMPLPLFRRGGSAVYVEVTGSANPLNSANVTQPVPTFVDIDNDGDQDVFIGEGPDFGSGGGDVLYFENTGTAQSPAFAAEQANPFGLDLPATGGPKAAPAFADLDGDGDLDAVLGSYDGRLFLFQNTGSVSAPAFRPISGGNNPLDFVDVGSYATPAFVDIDDDGDQDVFVGNNDFLTAGQVAFFENTGTANAPAFVEQVGAANPLALVNVNEKSVPAFVDCDGDGDQDAFVGEFFDNGAGISVVHFFENTGSAQSPSYVERTGDDNPLGSFTDDFDRAPAFVDIDGDGDQDAFVGANVPGGSNRIAYYRNDGNALPVELTDVRALVDGEAVTVSWATASETNNAGFAVEHRPRAAEGALPEAWQQAAFVPGQGTTTQAQTYTFRLEDLAPGTHQVRLKQIDHGGAATYSRTMEVAVELPEAVVLAPAYPNPFNPESRFTLQVRRTQSVRVAVYDALGRRLALLHEGPLAGSETHTFRLDGSAWPSGVYLYEAVGEDFREAQTVMLVK